MTLSDLELQDAMGQIFRPISLNLGLYTLVPFDLERSISAG